MTVTWLGAGLNCNYYQGPQSDMNNVPSPRNGDMYLDTTNGKLYTYQDGWAPLNG